MSESAGARPSRQVTSVVPEGRGKVHLTELFDALRENSIATSAKGVVNSQVRRFLKITMSTLGAVASLSACMPPPSLVPDDTIVTHFDNMNTPSDYWMRELEIQAERQKLDVNTLPEQFRRCVADELVSLTPPDVAVSVETFVKSDRYKDYYVLVDKVKTFNAQFKRERGMELFPFAEAYCQGKGANLPAGTTYRAMLENGMASGWQSEGHPKELSPKYFDCIVTETIATFTPSELAELDSIAKSRSNVARIDEIVRARDARFGGSSDNQVLTKCAALKGT